MNIFEFNRYLTKIKLEITDQRDSLSGIYNNKRNILMVEILQNKGESMESIEETLIWLCPICGKSLKIEHKGFREEREVSVHCEELCSNHAAIP